MFDIVILVFHSLLIHVYLCVKHSGGFFIFMYVCVYVCICVYVCACVGLGWVYQRERVVFFFFCSVCCLVDCLCSVCCLIDCLFFLCFVLLFFGGWGVGVGGQFVSM